MRYTVTVFGFEGTINMARWLSWLERRPVTAEVRGSNPLRVAINYIVWDLSSAGRASALQAEGHRFEPCRSHWFLNCVMLLYACTPMWLNWQSSWFVISRLSVRVRSSAFEIIFISLKIYNYINCGWIPEWPKGTDCKSAATCFGGSNPPPPI